MDAIIALRRNEKNKEIFEAAGMSIRLSICIPTYNFGAFIGETLESILSQVTPEIEVVVVDGASTDNTFDVVTSFAKRFPQLRYHRLTKKGGIDKDMAETVARASGDYCWIMSSDDVIRPGAIAKMLRLMDEEADVYVCGLISCDFHMNPKYQEPILPADCDGMFDFNCMKDRHRYFENGLSLAAYFSFCSSLMVSRHKWNLVSYDSKFDGGCWGHVARILGMMPHGLRVRYVHEPMLNKRGDNDSFLSHGEVNRVRIDVDGYNQLADIFFAKDSFEAFHIRRILRECTGINHLFRLKMQCSLQGKLEDARTLDRVVAKLYCDPLPKNKIKHMAYKYTPFSIYRLVNWIYKLIKSRRSFLKSLA